MKRSAILLLATFALAGGQPAPAASQVEISARSATLRIGGRLHGQYQASSVDGAVNDFFIRRARLIVDGSFNDFVTGRMQTDFSGGGASLLDAYVRLAFDDAFRVDFGQMKQSFDLFELSSSTDLSVIERTGRITGFSACTGVGSVCSSSRLTEALSYAGRDAGVRVSGTSGSVVYQATVTNGEGVGSSDVNDGKSLAGRVAVDVAEGVTVAGNVSAHDYLDPADETRHGVAWGADVQLGTWRDGLLVQAGVVGGDNWRSLDALDEPGHFLAVQAIASYYRATDGDRIVGIEPVLRVSLADPDGEIDDDGGTLVTPGLMLYFLGKNKIGANLDYYVPRTGDSEFSFRLGTFLYF